MSQMIQDAKRRIENVRKQDVEVLVLRDGAPVPDAKVSLRMKQHDFLFGAVCYKYGTYETDAENQRFSEEFTKLFNYTMVPYHWSWYEPERHQYNEPYTSNLIRWAQAHGLKKKLHALIWHELCPDWVTFEDDVKALYFERISHLMANFGEDFDFFDVANETTVNYKFDNPVTRWVDAYGPMNMIRFGTDLVRSYRPDAKLLYGDWNVHVEAYYAFLQQMRDNNIDIDILGVQSHMHSTRWTWEQTAGIMDRAASFGWPLHFPECSIGSGWPIGEINFAAGAMNQFSETEDDLYDQAEYARDFYTLVFSHPAVEALSWFDFTDHRWLGAPAGVVTEDLKIKPVYEALYQLIHRDWHSDADMRTNGEGVAKSRLFFGTYDIAVTTGDKTVSTEQVLRRRSFYEDNGKREPRRVVIKL